tara:strand:- start:38 stop:316 length:279 start_codon:yes stop_codon:yes gene_type:complete
MKKIEFQWPRSFIRYNRLNMSSPFKSGSRYECNQGGGMKITIISMNDERNYHQDGRYVRTGDIIYVYDHNDKVGQMKQYSDDMWNSEWKSID